jgi:transketolase
MSQAHTTSKPLKIKNLLADNPTGSARFTTTVKNKAGAEVTLADPKATRALVALMNQHAVIGGAAAHWGGPAAFAEIMAAAHEIMFQAKSWHQAYHFVNDAGHTENGIYALRANYGFDGMTFESLKGFRSIDSKLTGHGEAHLNPEGVLISNGPLGSGVPQAQGLALADKLLGNDRITLCALSDGGAMEGEAREALAAIPGLAAKGKLNPFVLMISDNNTKLSGRIGDDSFSMAPTFEALETLGWNLMTVENGHDLEKVYQALEGAIESAKADATKPVAIRFKTIKGYGVKSTEESASGGHGYPLGAYDPKLVDFINEIYDGSAPEEFTKWAQDILASKPEAKAKTEAPVKSEKVQPGFARACERAMNEGLPLFSVAADLQGSTGIAPFHKAYPQNSLDIGVAEANMVSTAVGLAKAGFIPIVDTFAQFGITKGNLPLIMANLSQGPVFCLFSHTGFQDAADGASHQATTYFSAVSSIPHTTVISCSCSKEAEEYMYAALHEYKKNVEAGKTPNSYVFFYGRENFPHYYNESENYAWKKAQVLREGGAATIVATGPTVAKALKAADELASHGTEVTVINNAFVNEPDTETIGAALKKTEGRLITIEDHQVIAGMGAMLCHALLQDGQSFKTIALGNKGEFGQSAYKADHLYAKHGMDDQAIVSAVKSLL